jgi:hypothetical protein
MFDPVSIGYVIEHRRRAHPSAIDLMIASMETRLLHLRAWLAWWQEYFTEPKYQ